MVSYIDYYTIANQSGVEFHAGLFLSNVKCYV